MLCKKESKRVDTYLLYLLEVNKAVSIVLSRGPSSREVLLVKRHSRLPFLGEYLAFPSVENRK